MITKTIQPIPPAPTKSDPENFDDRADAFLKRLSTLDDELNEWAQQANALKDELNNTSSYWKNALISTGESYKNDLTYIRNETEKTRNQIDSVYSYVESWKKQIETIVAALKFKGNWYGGAVAYIGDIYAHNGALWVSVANGNTEEPSTTSSGSSGWLPLGGEQYIQASPTIYDIVDGIGKLWNAVLELQGFCEGLLEQIENLENKVNYIFEEVAP